MTDYCSQCCSNFGIKTDIDLFMIALKLKPGRNQSFICEGCNNRAILKDRNGKIFLGKIIDEKLYLYEVPIESLMNISN